MRDIRLDQLQTFMDVADLASFAAAAVQLNLSETLVDRHIRELEGHLGVRLIDRSGDKATPTAAGMELLAHARRIGDEVTSAVDAMAEYAGGAQGRVCIGSGATFCIYLLPPILADLRRRFPELDITVRTGHVSDILKGMEDDSIDIGVVTLPVSSHRVDVTPLLNDDYFAIAAAEDDRLPAVVTPASLAGLPLILFEAGFNTRQIIDEWFAASRVRFKTIMDLGSIEAIKQLVGAGLGCAIVPGLALRRSGDRVPLTIRPLSPMLHRKLGLAVRRNRMPTPAVRETVKALRTLG